MIVPMKKIWCLCQAKDARDTLEKLRTLGVVHVEHQQVPQGKDIAALQEDILLAGAAGDLLFRFCDKKDFEQPAQPAGDWKTVSRHIIDAEKRLDQLEEYGRIFKNRVVEWEGWGDFDPEKIHTLAERKIYARFYQIPEDGIRLLDPALIVRKITARNGVVNSLIVSRERMEIPHKEIAPPKMSLSAMRQRLAKDEEVAEALREEIRRQAAFFKDIERQRADMEKELRFHQALQGMGGAGGIVYLCGYVPFDAVDILVKAAREEQWAVSIQDPSEEDPVPTLIRTPRWVSLIKPVFDLLGIIPGYRELDVSVLFLIFFSIFFGIIIGDAGYGLIYLMFTAWMQKRSQGKASAKNIVLLLYLLSSCAVVWGVLTGTFFGQQWLLQRGVQGMLPVLNDVKVMQTFCFFLGALHLSIAHAWRALLKAPSAAALADAGWICVLWTAFFLARALILGYGFPLWGKWLLVAGISLVIVFTNPQRNMVKAVGEGLGTLALSLMNNFTDVVSYVRLFAVGLAGVAIAETANSMAAGLGGGVGALAGGALIVLVGHALNIILGPISVLVHGVRLNVLEFSGHASITWSGIIYEPLKE
jgi:V/A-type H+-transporting ATPase subunit I